MSKSRWSFKTAAELSAALGAKKVSAVELAQEAIDRIERHDGKINAVCVRDFTRALEAARAADAARASGDTKPLLGIPMTVKESYNVAGLPTTWGNFCTNCSRLSFPVPAASISNPCLCSLSRATMTRKRFAWSSQASLTWTPARVYRTSSSGPTPARPRGSCSTSGA